MDEFEEYEEEEYASEDQSGQFDPLKAEGLPPVEIQEGIFGEFLEEIEEYNSELLEYIQEAYHRGELTDAEANVLWDNESVDLEGTKTEAAKFEQMLNNEAERILALRDSGELSDFQAELKLAELGDKKARFKRNLQFQSVGLSMDKIIDTADDAGHIIEDTYDPETRSLRKNLLKDLTKVSRSNRKAIIDNLLENGEIDEDQCAYLCTEFL